MIPLPLHVPAYLLVGNEEQMYNAVEALLQQLYCSFSGPSEKKRLYDCFCSQCRKIKQHQHEAALWLDPETDYSRNSLHKVMEKIQFQNSPDEQFFFIIPRADELSIACANRLLKSIEEPPTGYHFIFLTGNEQALIQTIRSRCMILVFPSSQQAEQTTLQSFFLTPQSMLDPYAFEAYLKQKNISLEQAHEAVDLLLKMLHDELKTNQTPLCNERITFLYKACKHPAQAGSGHFFLKNLYLNFPRAAV